MLVDRQLQPKAAEDLPEPVPVHTANADDVLRCSVRHDRADQLRSGPSVRHDRDVVDPACTDQVAEERTADDKDSVRIGHRIAGELRSRWEDSKAVEDQHGDIPDSRSAMAFPGEVAYAVACDESVAAEEVPGDGER